MQGCCLWEDTYLGAQRATRTYGLNKACGGTLQQRMHVMEKQGTRTVHVDPGRFLIVRSAIQQQLKHVGFTDLCPESGDRKLREQSAAGA